MVARAVDALAINNAIKGQLDNVPEEISTLSPLKLSASGNDPAQAYACSTMAQAAYRTFLINLKNTLPNTRIYAMDPDTNVLLATNSTLAQVSIGQVWTFDNVLTDLGLKVIQLVGI